MACARPGRALLVGSGLAQRGRALIVVGGGNTGPDIVAKALGVAGGTNAVVAVLPQSSAEPDAGDDSVRCGKTPAREGSLKVSSPTANPPRPS